MRKIKNAIARGAALSACLTLGACDDDSSSKGGAAGAPAVAPVSYAGEVQPLFELACNCHTGPNYMTLGAPFSLEASVAYGNIVSAPSQQVPTMQLVVPGSLNDSYLWLKVNGTQAEVSGGGQIMPPGVPLNEMERDLVGRWIVSGAQP